MESEQFTHHLAVLGAGVMGTSITVTALGHGIPVCLVDLDDATLDRARARVAQELRHAQLLGALPAGRDPGALTTTTSFAEAADATAVIEAVTEVLEVKRKALMRASDLVRPGTPLISNTSGFPIGELADGISRAEDLVGTHFMNPSYLITMVEFVPGPHTSERTVTAARRLLEALGRRPVTVGDTAGFVTSRLLHPMINTAARLVAEGTATARTADLLMQGCLGHPTGPLRTADLIGLDNLVDSLNTLHERTGDPSCRPCDLLVAKVAAGELGRKSGRGFYQYNENGVELPEQPA
ncbi:MULTISPECIES: 3-hydroxyacyl-CoA dehydrogenase family protein [unclassified Streptomyces]|uniref:3-hydroxyacyl-CoA dehydrogenase family protein n=1 Tax=unclassified Streptomyces TaxID=2593676 RepID=UPI002DD91545|nr:MULTISPECIES: 3-hydroxyacyl-CoA dehydrogenase family protein [unclassified Streptomyces]WSA90492.1 3-hydroxyacyl-CoA dehydrogenase family protein [Streptomyces sp. NBC_01795]WSB74817.1 3-hydroxyacyl-CoA dehydrogenase family protein [Streptomyces sp. NBC_01775]WSS16900.1 3-hydroxyacyl-CoA dehydrogenase family protein [Streptomyces sp. NBC_01186]WSS45643.1 3-hydroxyacyl-CoA dehydrogenase family protein [Streptomyces sp. NBC_01187]